jgi:hypothetical protein
MGTIDVLGGDARRQSVDALVQVHDQDVKAATTPPVAVGEVLEFGRLDTLGRLSAPPGAHTS